jgi:hypothetical protein
MKRCTTTLVLFLFILPGFGQTISNYTISGYVREKVSRESLIGVNVYLSDHKTGTTTNTYGFYSITLPAADSVEIIVSYVGFTPEIVKIKLNKNIELNIDLKPSVLLDEVTVSSSRIEKQSQSVKMSTINLQIAQIKNVPSLFGEKDVLKVLQFMPGVQTGSEGSSGLYVRGGGPDQNLIILDDAIVYNASHLFGFFSLFNGDAIKSVELTKGGFPARYGGRLSSVLDINMKEGNKEEWHGEGGIGLISSRMTLEGPIKKGKSSILISGRRTYADLIMYPLLGEEKIGYYFYDLNAKINYDFGRKNKLYLSGYFGNDNFSMKTNNRYYNHDIGFRWGNGTGTLRWNHLFTNKLFSNTSAIFSNYTFRIFDRYKTTGEVINDYRAEYYSGIKDYSLKYDIDYLPNPNHKIKAGAISIIHRFNPYAFIEEDIPNNTHINDVTFTNSLESGIYFEDTWQALHNLKVNGGIRFSHFLADQNQYHFFEPRLSVALNLKNDFAVKGSYASMSQYIHMISNTGISLPTDLWVPTTDKVKPQESQQLALGLVKDFSKPDITFSLEGYYKKMDNVIGYKEGASFMNLDEPTSVSDNNWEAKVTEGDAWSYGLELLLQKKEGRLSGWIGYTLSWTQMQFDSINFGRKFWARYDRRHDLSLVAIYKLNKHITFSGTWVYGTGNSVTLPTSEYIVGHQWNYDSDKLTLDPSDFSGFKVKEFSARNNFRMNAYHRLDLGVQFHKEKKWGERIWEISVSNVYNHKNPFFYTFDSKVVNNVDYGFLNQVSLFPIIPSISYSFKF